MTEPHGSHISNLRKTPGIRAWWKRLRFRRYVKRNPGKMIFLGTREGVSILDDLSGVLPRLDVPPGADPRSYMPPVKWEISEVEAVAESIENLGGPEKAYAHGIEDDDDLD